MGAYRVPGRARVTAGPRTQTGLSAEEVQSPESAGKPNSESAGPPRLEVTQ